jgi:hypothetical protein
MTARHVSAAGPLMVESPKYIQPNIEGAMLLQIETVVRRCLSSGDV